MNMKTCSIAFVIGILFLTHANWIGVQGDRSSGWGTTEDIRTYREGHAYSPKIAFDHSGNAIAVWYQFEETMSSIWANRYTAGSGWGSARLIENDNAGSASDPEIAFDRSGNAIVVWHQSDGTRINIWANRYTAGSGWGTANLIETDNSGSAAYPQIEFDPFGNAIAVWMQSDGSDYNIWANRYTLGTGWGSAHRIETNSGEASRPQIAVDPFGNFITVYYHNDGSRFNIWANRYTAGSGWGTAELIETDNAGHAQYPQVAMDTKGNAIAVWYQSDGTRDNIWANRYTAGSGWGTAQLIETENLGNAVFPTIAIDPFGNAIAIWYQSDGTWFNIWANRYTAGSGWGTAEVIETGSGSSYNPKIAFDIFGNAIAVWYQYDGTLNKIWTNRYTAGSGWGTAEHIETESGSAAYPQIAFDPSGNAITVWMEYNGLEYTICANRYIMPDTTAPPLDVTYPNDGIEVGSNIVLVNGTTEKGAVLNINGILGFVMDDGSFSMNIPLHRGENHIIITATDASGNINSTSLTVTYTDPLIAELSAVLSSLSSINDLLSDISAEVSGLEGALLVLEGQIDSLEGQMDSSATSYSENISYLKQEIEKINSGMEQVYENIKLLNDTIAGMGNGDGANLSGIRSSIESIEQDLKGIQTDVASLEGDLSALGADVEGIKGTKDGNEDRIKDLELLVFSLIGIMFVSIIVGILLFIIIMIMMVKRKGRIEE